MTATGGATLPFWCPNCRKGYGENTVFVGEGVDVFLSGNTAQCPGCGRMNGQAVPAGRYVARQGQLELVREVLDDLLSAKPTRADLEALAELMQETKRLGLTPEAVSARVAAETPFHRLAPKLTSEQWFNILLSVILSLFASPLAALLYPPPAQPAQPAQLTHQQLDELATDIAAQLGRATVPTADPPPPAQSATRRLGRAPARNGPCPCGNGKKYKRCHGAPDLASP